MKQSIRVTVLVENTARLVGTLGEHGLSYWIDTGQSRILFDTGQGQALVHNARRLDIDLTTVDAIVLSHGHYDHTGGLKQAMEHGARAPLYLHPQAVIRRYSGKPGNSREIGLASVSEAELHQSPGGLRWTTQPTRINPEAAGDAALWVTGEIPRNTAYEDTGGPFFLDEACTQPDPIIDDQAVYFDTANGLVVILGCAHAGIINTLNHITAKTHRPVHAVIGGTHLLQASKERLENTLTELRRINPEILAPSHCTGPKATALLWTTFPQSIAQAHVGQTWTFAAV